MLTQCLTLSILQTIDPVNNNIKAHMQFITAMPEYNGKSLEQLRFEDYLLKRRGALPTITNLPNTTPAATDSETSTSPSEPPAVTGPFTGTHGPPFTVIKVSLSSRIYTCNVILSLSIHRPLTQSITILRLICSSSLQ